MLNDYFDRCMWVKKFRQKLDEITNPTIRQTVADASWKFYSLDGEVTKQEGLWQWSVIIQEERFCWIMCVSEDWGTREPGGVACSVPTVVAGPESWEKDPRRVTSSVVTEEPGPASVAGGSAGGAQPMSPQTSEEDRQRRRFSHVVYSSSAARIPVCGWWNDGDPLQKCLSK